MACHAHVLTNAGQRAASIVTCSDVDASVCIFVSRSPHAGERVDACVVLFAVKIATIGETGPLRWLVFGVEPSRTLLYEFRGPVATSTISLTAAFSNR